MTNRHILFPLCIMLFSLVSLYIIGQFDQPRFQESSIGAGFFPTMIAIFQLLLCAGLIVQHKMKKQREAEPPLLTAMSVYGILFVLGYVAGIYFLGYLIASLLAFTLYLVFFKVKKVSWYIIAWAFVGLIYYVFGEVLFIALPEGLIFY